MKLAVLYGVLLASAAVLSADAAQAQVLPAVDRSLLPYASTKDSVRLPDGRTIHLVCMGEGSPVVLLAAGGDGWSIAWNLVQPAVAAKTRVCAWDRAGLGLSSPSPEEQTIANTTKDLKAALGAGGIVGPYVVVGHSIGGFDALLFADRYRASVAGMVLVDPSMPANMATRLNRLTPAITALLAADPPFIAGLHRCAAGLRAGTVRAGAPDPDGCLHPPPPPPDYPPELQAALEKAHAGASPEAIASALDNIAFYASPRLLEQDGAIVSNPQRSFGDMPLIVLSAGQDGSTPDLPAAIRAELPTQMREKQQIYRQLATLSTRGVHRVVPDSTHDIPHIRPQAVVAAIDEVVDDVRNQRGAAVERER